MIDTPASTNLDPSNGCTVSHIKKKYITGTTYRSLRGSPPGPLKSVKNADGTWKNDSKFPRR